MGAINKHTKPSYKSLSIHTHTFKPVVSNQSVITTVGVKQLFCFKELN